MSHRPYLPIEPALVDHPKTRALAKIWGCHPYMVVGFLVKLWGYCLEFEESGTVDGRPADVLDEFAAPCVATSIGTLPTVREALLRVGFIDEDGRLHDWEEYAGALIERRRKDRRRKRLARRGLPQERRETSDGQGVDRRGNSAPREEKSREEKSRQLQQQPAAAQPRSPQLDYATRCCIAVNTVLDEQLAGTFVPLVANVERPTAKAWEAAGIPVELAEQVLGEMTRRFPNGRGRQPQSLGYFTAALHEAHAKTTLGPAGMARTPAEQMREAAAEERRKEAQGASS